MLLDEVDLEKQIEEELKLDGLLMVDIPTKKVEYEERFSLVNGEYSVNDVNFQDASEDDLDLIVNIPTNKSEFKRRFDI